MSNKNLCPVFLLLCFAVFCSRSIAQIKLDDLQIIQAENFKNPPNTFRGIKWMGIGGTNLSDSGMIRTIQANAKSKLWGTVMFGPGGGPTTGLSDEYLKLSHRPVSDKGVAYLSEEYFRIYKIALQEASKNNMPLETLYDEWNYPSGIAGGYFNSKYPQDCVKSIELAEKNITGPGLASLDVPAGIYVGAVMMNRDTYRRIDISTQKKVLRSAARYLKAIGK